MLMGAVLPYRFNERIEGGKKQYDAITHIHFFDEVAFLSGLDKPIRPGKSTVRLGKWLSNHGATELHYKRLGEWKKWQYDGKKWRPVNE